MITGLTVEPLFQARDFILAYNNLRIRVFCQDYPDLAVEPIGNPPDRRYVHYMPAGRPEKLQRIELSVNIVKCHVDVILPLVFKIDARQSGFSGDVAYFGYRHSDISVFLRYKKPLAIYLRFPLQKPVYLRYLLCRRGGNHASAFLDSLDKFFLINRLQKIGNSIVMKGFNGIFIVSGSENDGYVAGNIFQRVETQPIGKAYVGKNQVNFFRFIKESAYIGDTWQRSVNRDVVEAAVE